MPDPTDILKIIASAGASRTSKKTQKETPTYEFTRRSYVAPKPPKPSETAKEETLKPIHSTLSKSSPQKESLNRPDVERIEKTVEKANNDLNVIENYNNSDDNSNSGFNPYKDFGGG